MNAIFIIFGLFISLILGIITLPFKLLYGLFSTEVHHRKTGLSRSDALDDLVHSAEQKQAYEKTIHNHPLMDYGIFSFDIGKWGIWDKKGQKFLTHKSNDRSAMKKMCNNLSANMLGEVNLEVIRVPNAAELSKLIS